MWCVRTKRCNTCMVSLADWLASITDNDVISYSILFCTMILTKYAHQFCIERRPVNTFNKHFFVNRLIEFRLYHSRWEKLLEVSSLFRSPTFTFTYVYTKLILFENNIKLGNANPNMKRVHYIVLSISTLNCMNKTRYRLM